MSQKIEINAQVRSDVGKGASRRLRRSGNSIPGIIYGAEEDPVNLTINTNELAKAMQSETFFSQILDVKFDGKSQQAVLRDMQRNPATEKVLHVDFMRVSANKPIQVSVPLHFVSFEAAPIDPRDFQPLATARPVDRQRVIGHPLAESFEQLERLFAVGVDRAVGALDDQAGRDPVGGRGRGSSGGAEPRPRVLALAAR